MSENFYSWTIWQWPNIMTFCLLTFKTAFKIVTYKNSIRISIMMQRRQQTFYKKVNTWIIYFSISKIGLGQRLLTCYILGNLCYTQCLLFVFRYVFLHITNKNNNQGCVSIMYDNLSVIKKSECTEVIRGHLRG